MKLKEDIWTTERYKKIRKETKNGEVKTDLGLRNQPRNSLLSIYLHVSSVMTNKHTKDRHLEIKSKFTTTKNKIL